MSQEAWDTPDDAESGSELGAAETSLSSYAGSLGGAWWQKFGEVCLLSGSSSSCHARYQHLLSRPQAMVLLPPTSAGHALLTESPVHMCLTLPQSSHLTS